MIEIHWPQLMLMNLPLLFFLKMALSAGTPILRGYLADLDCRWSVISGSVDDRTPEERGLEVSLKKVRGQAKVSCWRPYFQRT